MAGRECFHCKEWIEEGVAHDCWSTTEAALTRDLAVDLRDAWERLRETAVAFGEQRIYASLNSIMFSRTACYFFVRPKRNFLEVCFFLGRTVKAAQIRKSMASSRVKVAHLVHVRHRDEVEAPLTDWLHEPYVVSEDLTGRRPQTAAAKGKRTSAAKATRTVSRAGSTTATGRKRSRPT